MVSIRFKYMEVQELILWGSEYRERQESVGMGWDEDQQVIIDKLKKAIGRSIE